MGGIFGEVLQIPLCPSNLAIASCLMNTYDVVNSAWFDFPKLHQGGKKRAKKSFLKQPRNILWQQTLISSPFGDSLLFSCTQFKTQFSLVIWGGWQKVLFQLGCTPVVTKTWL